MVESVGKKLHQARLQRGLTIDEAAHATKLRPDKIAALENDDYSRFANNIYAKGFLQIYGRFLKVDVEEFARTLDNSNPISISDYQYLSNAQIAKVETISVRRDERRAPSLAPLVVFVFLGAVGVMGWWVYQNYERLNPPAPTVKTEAGSPETATSPAPNPDAAFVNEAPSVPAATPVPVAPVPHIAAATPVPALVAPTPLAVVNPPRPGTPAPLVGNVPRASTPIPRATPPAPAALPGQAPTATPMPVAGAPTGLPSPERDFVNPAPVATHDPSARPAGVNEVLVATVRKTWVTVRKDDPKAAPIFEDFVYPNTRPLKLTGARFFIEAQDPGSVQITKNGLPYAYQPSGMPVQ